MYFQYLLNKTKSTLPLLLAIFFIALLLRTVSLSTLPNGVFTDEIVSGYVGRFILETGKDPYGNTLPLLYFNKFGDYRVILPMYLTGIATYLFGTTIFALRIVPALFGALAIFPMYTLVASLTTKRSIAFLSAFLLGITPWHIILSRAESEGIIGLTVFLFACNLLFKKDKRALIIAAALFVLTYFLYPVFRIVSPLTAWLILIMKHESATYKGRLIIAGMLTCLTLIILQTPFGAGRFTQTSFFANKEIAARIAADNSNYAQAHGPGNARIAYLFHNRYTGYAREFLIQASEYLSPSFLFFTGGKPYRYVVPSFGLLPLTFGILMILAIAFAKLPSRTVLFITGLIGIGIIPAILTGDDIPNVHRSLLLPIPLIFLTAYGIIFLGSRKRLLVRSLALVAGLCISLELIVFWHHYTYLSPSHTSVLRGDGLWEGATRLIEMKGSYTKIYSTNFEDFPIYVLYQMNQFDNNLAGKFKPGVLLIPQVENIVFIGDNCPKAKDVNDIPSGKILFIINGECENYPLDTKEVRRIVRKDATVTFKFMELVR